VSAADQGSDHVTTFLRVAVVLTIEVCRDDADEIGSKLLIIHPALYLAHSFRVRVPLVRLMWRSKV